jgi:hypothetical protein
MSTTINITETAVNVVVTEETINIEASGGQGPVGVGVPAGGTAGQILAKINSTNYNTQWINNTDLVGLTSVGVSMPAAFSVANSPLTANGTIAVTGAGNALQYINGLGNLVTFPTLTGFVTSVTGTSPIASSGGTTPAISIAQATTSVSGFLSSTDWNTFNGKQNALTNPVTGTGTTNTLPKFTGASAIGNSNITDTGTAIALNSDTAIGTTTLAAATKLTLGGSETAVSAIARGGLINSTLVAAANSDNLIALDIAPTYTNGAFTGVNNIGLRLINTLNSTGDVDPKLNPLFQLSSSFWNSSLGAVRATASLQVTSYQRNTNPTISKLSFLVGTDNAAATEQMFITSAGLFGTNGGANFSGGTGSYLYDVTLIQTAAATSSTPVSSNRLVIKGNSWNSAQGNKPSMGYLQMINVTNNANPTTDKLSFFVGSADNANFGNMVGNATERLAIRTDGIFSYFNLAGTEFLRLVGSTGNIIMQNGGTFTDAGFRLDVNGTTRFIGTASSDTAPLGSELAAVTGTGTNWTLAGTNLNVGGYTHATGSVDPLTTALAAVNGTYYQIAYTITGRTTGSITINYGGTSTSGITATGATGPLASSTAVLTITPTTDFNGTVVLSIKTISASAASSTFSNSTLGSNIEFRASNINTNTFIGLQTGRRNTTGGSNTYVGSQTGINNTTGLANTFIGQGAGTNNVIGNFNVFIGSGSGATNILGGDNTFVGTSSGNLNTGSLNTFLGTNTGRDNTTGGNNTFLGRSAGQANTTGGSNVMIGQAAGRFITGGVTANTIVNNSIFIGDSTRAAADNQTNQIVIGQGTTGLGSNTTIIGTTATTITGLYGNIRLVSGMGTAPATSTSTGTTGDIVVTAGFIYVCTATNTWVRTALTTF